MNTETVNLIRYLSMVLWLVLVIWSIISLIKFRNRYKWLDEEYKKIADEWKEANDALSFANKQLKEAKLFLEIEADIVASLLNEIGYNEAVEILEKVGYQYCADESSDDAIVMIDRGGMRVSISKIKSGEEGGTWTGTLGG